MLVHRTLDCSRTCSAELGLSVGCEKGVNQAFVINENSVAAALCGCAGSVNCSVLVQY